MDPSGQMMTWCAYQLNEWRPQISAHLDAEMSRKEGVPNLGLYTIHPGKFTWNTKMEVWKMIFLFNWVMFRFHVNFWRVYSNIFELNQIYTPESLTYPLSKGGWKTSFLLKWSRFWGYGGVPLFFSAHQYPSWNRLPSQISYLSTVATPSINPQNAALFSRMSQSILLEVLSFQQSTHRCS